ncbi:prepilin peptidase [Falsigemmobacter faecalis]|uniref:Prepilin type IV endopeptidase peptidase domain-containing protein n=1 Tax=Falsigemmobacter faecalis TaxID=2488730 RepID=A0A3P3DHZ3_9RHOB|nr:prepilin peptidase [Falsigemmobacter faecalis]RRH72218.1 hypothetical protein EG244_15465 [Falsigemmobacter faecalis]
MTFATTATEALWFLPFVAPVAFYVAWSDMAAMKIPNKAVLALLVVYAVIGLIALPVTDYAWRWLHFGVVLVIGFGLTMLGAMGGGDAKFGAAMAPFIALADLKGFLLIFSASLLAAFAAHRLARSIPALRALAPTWVSWSSPKFPMGLALAASLMIYLGLAAAQ